VFDWGGVATDQGGPIEQFDLDAAGAPHLDALSDDERVAGGGTAVCAQVAGEGRGSCTGGGILDDSAPAGMAFVFSARGWVVRVAGPSLSRPLTNRGARTVSTASVV
jgi:hypothetical protein